ncbi:hypothetical protein GGF44_000553 [Coemansia sp. RSA 1694]|nr:hypothetical protein GGF44_000553 [Coemansia sp. RSA 1694]
MHSLRKKPFSAKQKKTQIQAKRAKKREQAENEDEEWDFSHQASNATEPASKGGPSTTAPTPPSALAKPPQQAVVGSDGRRVNKLTSQFDKLTRVEIEANKQRSMQPLQRLSGAEGLTMSFDDAYSADVDIPVRPAWSYGESRDALERREERVFAAWLENINRLRDMETVSLYEKNLEVWRQLWRVVEISDVLLMVVDIRHPVLHFPPSLYRYITQTTGKPLVVVLNKTDLVADATVRAWKLYFKQQFPSVVLTSFCCYRNTSSNDVVNDIDLAGLKLKKSKPRRRTYDSTLVGDLFEACRGVCESQKRDLVDWDALIARYRSQSAEGNAEEAEEDDNEEEEGEESEGEEDKEEAVETTAATAETAPGEGHIETVSGRYVTLGLVGHPNVGKSTVINSIIGRTVVSTSRTPGHTKHFQTIHVTPTLRLCDCPGLVFPCVVNRPLQVLAGLYNIAQIQEPYTSVQYLAERVPVEQMLALRMPDHQSASSARGDGRLPPRWSAWAICEAFAIDRGFYTSKAARPDVYRAALHILRWELDGRILMSFKPPGFFDEHANFVDSIAAAASAETKNKSRLEMLPHERHSSHSDNESSSSADNDNEVRRPIGQQSAFALLEEEDC